MLKNYIRALRLPFVSTSLLPFIFGSIVATGKFHSGLFLIGLVCAVSTHLGANLINDYADSKSGVDWKDRSFYGFFGGSKLIQEGVFLEAFYLKQSLIYFGISFLCVVGLLFLLGKPIILLYFMITAFLGYSYSHKPFQFSYHYLGEIIIFALFGPSLVMGAYYIQTGIFPSPISFLLSLPFGLFTTAILFSNEVPDYPEDSSSGKNTWVNLVGPQRSYLLYSSLVGVGLLSIVADVFFGLLHWGALGVFLFAPLVLKAGKILKNDYEDKQKLVQSSELTIKFQIGASLVLILAAFLV